MLEMIERQLATMIANPQMFALYAIILVVSIGLHEWGHAVMADMCGDPTPRSQGRVTLNPLAHLDPMGTIAMFFFGFGWGKPVMVQPLLFRNKRWDDVKVSGAGPAMNLFQALVYASLYRAFSSQGALDPTLYFILSTGLFTNVMLMCFNLIPVGPLDGASIVKNLLPLRQAYEFEQFNRSWGMLVMFALLFTGAAGMILLPIRDGVAILVGIR